MQSTVSDEYWLPAPPEPTGMDRPISTTDIFAGKQDVSLFFLCLFCAFLDCVCQLKSGPTFFLVPTLASHRLVSPPLLHPRHPASTQTMRPMEQLEHIDHHSIPPALIAALILLVLFIVLPNVFLAPTDPKGKSD